MASVMKQHSEVASDLLAYVIDPAIDYFQEF
jgi:hypothetical protein